MSSHQAEHLIHVVHSETATSVYILMICFFSILLNSLSITRSCNLHYYESSAHALALYLQL